MSCIVYLVIMISINTSTLFDITLFRLPVVYNENRTKAFLVPIKHD